MHQRVVVIGAGLAGTRTAQALRQAGYTGEVLLVGTEQHAPYDRPALSKQMLGGTWRPEALRLAKEGALATAGIEHRVVESVRMSTPDVVDLDGELVPADFVVVATGAHPRRLPGQPVDPRVGVLRTLEDSAALRGALHGRGSLAVVGAGLIGGEVATVARDLGLVVTLVEAGAPFERALGEAGAAHLAELHRARGVRLLDHRRTVAWDLANETTVGLVLDNGNRVDADTVLVAVGAHPATGWLDGALPTSSLPQHGGPLLCDSDGRVIGQSTLYAVGDVSAWRAAGSAIHTPGGHWTQAVEQAGIVGAVIAARTDPTSDHAIPEPGVRYVWSDQAGTKIQVVGDPLEATDTDVLTVPGGGAVIVASQHGTVVAVTTFGLPRLLRHVRPLVREAADRPTALQALAGVLDVGKVPHPTTQR